MLGTMKPTVSGWAAAGLLLLAGVVGTAGGLGCIGGGPGAAPGREEDWDVARLASHLRDRGLDLQVTTVPESSETDLHAAFFSRSGGSWKQWSRLPKLAERAGLWRGVVYCEKVRPDECWAPEVSVWG